jgi:H+-transporting ATPase
MAEEKETKGEHKARFADKSLDEVLDELSVDPEEGLSPDQVKKRKKKYGLNKIEEEDKNPLLKLFKHFWGPIPWMLEIAIILAAIAQHWEDLSVIAVMLLINSGVSYWHEHKAESAIAALKKKLAPKANVIRDGKTKEIKAKKLVPGDIVKIDMGDIVPADAMLLKDHHASVDESALTGESLPVDKEEGDLIFSGTTVKRGHPQAVITATGRDTKFARTVELVEGAGERSHFQKAVLRIGYFLITATLALDVLIGVVGWLRSDPIFEVLMFILVLTIAGIPQALPAVLSVTMTIGANRLARQKAIVSRLAAMEEMAGLEVLCADKTGTLTKNELELQEPVIIDAEDEHDLILTAALTVRRDGDDPIDAAVMGGLEDESELDEYEIKDFRPFDPTRKRAEADVSKDGKQFTAAKGAPQAILKLVDADEELKNKVTDKVDELGNKGFRALGVARKDDSGWIYLGILPLLDPPREDSAEVIEDAQNHGIDIRMLTGDHTAIGNQVAGQVGLKKNIKPADELFGDVEKKEDGDLLKDVSDEEFFDASGFAEVTPEHKFYIIKEFQSGDRIVAMTGDGVNDAPALQQADVGIAVHSATDAARSAADLVLTKPGLGVIINAIEEARRIFERMTSYSTFRIIETVRVLLFVTGSILVYNFYPLTPIMIVLLAILNDIPIMLIAYDNVPTAKEPVRWDMRRVLTIASVMGIGGVISSFGLLRYVESQVGLAPEIIQTMIFLKLLVAGHMTIYITRSRGWLWQKPWPNLLLIAGLEGTQIVGTLFAVYGILVTPIGWVNALWVWAYAIVWLLLLNGLNVITHKVLGTRQNQ